MSFINAKMLNESFMNITNEKACDEIITLRQLDENIISCKSKLISLKEQYDELKSTWKALTSDKDSLSFNSSMYGSESITESFNKAVADLKMEYEDTKTTLQYYKDIKNKTLLEAEVTLSKEQTLDPDTPINLRKMANDAVEREKRIEADRTRAQKEAKLRADAQVLLDQIDSLQRSGLVEDELFSEVLHLLVPDSGKADSVAGEMIRAINKILYRDWNDGDKFYEGYGLETCGPAAAYLMDHGYWDDFERIVNLQPGDEEYTDSINKIRDKILDDIQDIELLASVNEEDMLDADTSWLTENQPRYEGEIWISEAIQPYVDERLVDSWRLKDYIEDHLSYEQELRDAEVETPWSHYGDTSFNISNLTIDGKDRLEELTEYHLDGFWEDLVNELEEEYPNYFDNEDDDEDDYDAEDDEEDSVEEAFLTEAVLMETGDEDNIELFASLYTDDNQMKARVDRILNSYRESDNELALDIFKKASTPDQERIIELLQK